MGGPPMSAGCAPVQGRILPVLDPAARKSPVSLALPRHVTREQYPPALDAYGVRRQPETHPGTVSDAQARRIARDRRGKGFVQVPRPPAALPPTTSVSPRCSRVSIGGTPMLLSDGRGVREPCARGSDGRSEIRAEAGHSP